MARVDFYVLPDDQVEARSRFACRLAEKAYRLGHRIYLHAADAQQARALDELLWNFQPSSFVPHDLLESGAPASDAPVVVGWGEAAAGARDVLINLDLRVPAFFSRFERITEIVIQTPPVLQATRAAWRHYQEHGCEVGRREMGG